MQIIIVAELLVIIFLLIRKRETPPTVDEFSENTTEKATEEQKAFSEGISSIISYDFTKAKGAVRGDDK
jgi:hypothetical protein